MVTASPVRSQMERPAQKGADFMPPFARRFRVLSNAAAQRVTLAVGVTSFSALLGHSRGGCDQI